jgi:glycosyltransferase involved in cell wall biosynthesis
MRILYVTWDSPEVDYLDSLFLPIFIGLQRQGFAFDVLQFSWGATDISERSRLSCERAGIGYRRVEVSRRFGALGPMLGGRAIARDMRLRGSDALLVRGIMPSLAALRQARRARIPLALDLDGLQLDERIDFAGRSPLSLTHRLLRDVEYRVLHHARTILVRTHKAAAIAAARAGAGFDPRRLFVVGNGRDAATFAPVTGEARCAMRLELGFDPDAPLLVYVGSYGPQYRFDRMFELFDAVRRLHPRAGLLMLTAAVEPVTALVAANRPDYGDACRVLRVAPHDVPRHLAAGDVGLAFREPTFATQAVQPIKLGEYLLCGLTVAGTAEVGGVEDAIAAGAFLPVGDDSAAIADTATRIVAILPQRDEQSAAARRAGLAGFSLDRTIAGYASALALLGADGS